MSIESKHAYRFGYLKSEQWRTVRLSVLVRDGGACQICGEKSNDNDVHHIWYPENIYDTKEYQLIVLCRDCHEFCHAMLPECKTNDEEKGRAHWLKFRNAIDRWRIKKICLFQDSTASFTKASELRKAYKQLKEDFRLFKMNMPVSKPKSIESQLDLVLSLVKKWAAISREYAESVNKDVEDSDNQA